ncbi:MAG: tetratricopeptide repeat protein [Thermoanaerobaculia bacterium]
MSLERIEITPFALVAGEIVQNRRSGYLTVIHRGDRTVLFWAQGELVLAASDRAQESLGQFLVDRNLLPPDRVFAALGDDPNDSVSRFHETGLVGLQQRQSLLRDWLASIFKPLFALDEGTTAFVEDEPLVPEKRVFVQSTAALVVDGVRMISSGLVVRRCLGDLKREIAISRKSRFDLESMPLTEGERVIARSLGEPATIESLLRRDPTESLVAARVIIAMLSLGVFAVADEAFGQPREQSLDDMQRDLEMLAAIGPDDPRSLRAVALSRQMATMDHYQFLDVPRAATRAQIVASAEAMRKRFEEAEYPAIVRDAVRAISQRIQESLNVLQEANRRSAYDKLLHSSSHRGFDDSIQQRLNQKMIADHNYARAKELVIDGDYYGAIILLKQAVVFIPEFADAWYLLGICQERNPRWRRDAAESYQMALSVDPNLVDALISLGDLYKSEGMINRAQVCFEDALKIAPENQQAKSRLAGLKKR